MYHQDVQMPPPPPGWTFQDKRLVAALQNPGGSEGGVKAFPDTEWRGPSVPVEPLAYYRVLFNARTSGKACWFAVCYDEHGEVLDADIYDGLTVGEEWRETVGYIRAREGASAVRLGVTGVTDDVILREVALSEVTVDTVREGMRRIWQEVPTLEYTPPPGRHRYLSRTLDRLERGIPLRVLMLGDSIVNDTSNSNYETELSRIYPRADLTVLTSVRHRTGARYYRQEPHFQRYVLDRCPDLLIIGGISNGQRADHVRELIRLARRCLPDCEILVLTGPMDSDWRQGSGTFTLPLPSQSFERAFYHDRFTAYRDHLQTVCREEETAFFDMGSAWHRYLGASGKPYLYFHRDWIHANIRGKMILGELLLRWLAPDTNRG